ncbi:GspH/FimT family pseudopilin [Salinisphaera sp.]|uniref:GspH/FimT family pseudopilin n=1 Tax=Salinisphaera sp. TaxID=1914330 RepID=UPI002D785F93|nr:GspH/FimT family pseudopilin [Salinisphaera sp.]
MGVAGARGFTLLELMVTLAVAAVLLTIAIPSYRGLVQRNALTAQVNDLVGDLNYARSQAITRGKSVYLCTSADGNTCENRGNWSQGWIVYAPILSSNTDPPAIDQVLRVHGALDGQIQITGNQNITHTAYFDANGFAMGSIGHFTAAAANAADVYIMISGSGRIRTDDQPPS